MDYSQQALKQTDAEKDYSASMDYIYNRYYCQNGCDNGIISMAIYFVIVLYKVQVNNELKAIHT